MQVWPGQPYPLGATYDGTGTNFALFSEVAERVELCLFDDDGRSERGSSCPRWTAFVWHGYLPGVEPGPALRLPRARPVRPGHGAALQPAQAAARPVRQGDRRRHRLGPGAVRLPTSATRTGCRRRRLGAVHAQGVVVNPYFDWGNDRPPRHAVPPTR